MDRYYIQINQLGGPPNSTGQNPRTPTSYGTEICQEVEDSQHIFCCQHGKMKEEWKREFLKFKKSLRKITDIQVSTAIEVGIGGIGGEYSATFQEQFTTNSRVKRAFTEQETIGWDQFVLCRMAKSWSELGPLMEPNGCQKYGLVE